MTALDQHERLHPSQIPDIGGDLVAQIGTLSAGDVPVERVLAVLELLRNDEITLDQAAKFSGQSRERLAMLMKTLQKAA